MTDKDTFNNRLIFGDNVLALESLEQEFAGKVQCAFIDPPYNAGSTFTHYDRWRRAFAVVFARIDEYKGRVLRVIVNAAVRPLRVVTVYFDRAMRNKL